MTQANLGLPSEARIEFRIGINLGDVIMEGDDVYGDGVNVAARLQELAQPGGICLSGAARDQVRDRFGFSFSDRGNIQVKNIQGPVRLYDVSDGSTGDVQDPHRGLSLLGAFSRYTWLTSLVLISIVLPGVAWWYWEASGQRHARDLERQEQAKAGPNQQEVFSQASIAVLPFDNLSDDPAQEYFADGITEDIIMALSRIRSLAVIARNSTFVYKGKAVNVQEIGRDLGVRYVLEGSVRRADDRVRILAQLIDTETGSRLWAERFDREVSDVFAAQDEVTRNIVAALHLELPAAELERVKRKDTIVMQAYDYVLRRRDISLHYSPESQKRAKEMFNKAIELDPNYAQA